MQRITRGRLVLSLALVGALALAGCGGDDAYNISAEDQARIDMLTADLADANKKAVDDLAAAQARIDVLTVEIGMMPSDDAEGSGLKGQLAMAQAYLADAQMRAGELTTTIGMAADGEMAATGLHAQIAMKQGEIDGLMMTLGMMATDDAAATGLYAQIAMKQGEIDGLMMTLGMMATDDAEATGLYKQLADAQAMTESYKGMIGSMDDPASADGSLYAQLAAKQATIDSLQSQLDDVKEKLAEVEDTVETGDMMAASVEAKALYAVLGMSPGAPLAVTVEIEDGALKAMATGYTMADARPDIIDGWGGAMLTKKNSDGTVATAVVYSNRGTTGDLFLDQYREAASITDGTRMYLVDDGTDGIDWEGEGNNVKLSAAPTGGSKPGTTELKGSVMGVPGTFSCTAGTLLCTPPTRFNDDTIDEAGVTGMWMFTPEDPLAKIPGATSDYLTFGWWLMKDAGGMPNGYALLMDAPGMFRATDTNTEGGEAADVGLVGSATYKGGAAGKYALPSTTDDTYDGGHFTAVATITADFDVDNDAEEPGNDRQGIELSGMIDNFVTGAVIRDWTVKLMADGLIPAIGGAETDTTRGMQPVDNLAGDLDEPTVALTSEWSMGSAVKISGEWDPTFYHEGIGDPDAVPTDETIPDAVIGTFNAIGDAGRLQGAYGAMKEE